MLAKVFINIYGKGKGSSSLSMWREREREREREIPAIDRVLHLSKILRTGSSLLCYQKFSAI